MTVKKCFLKEISLFTIILFFPLLIFSQKLPDFKAEDQPEAPDYFLKKNWSALPFRVDAADVIPKDEEWINDSEKKVDVFYLYPTIYQKGKTWNADVNNKSLNRSIDKFPVKFQASVFNHVARVYVPRYRQSIAKVWDDPQAPNHKASLDLAYEDIKNAFEHYLKYYNNDRPIIIASHSQGSYLAIKLLQDYFQNTQMKNKLVAAYVVGYGIEKDYFSNLSPCKEEKDIFCYLTWASFRHDYDKEKRVGKLDHLLYENVCINPISWNQSREFVAADNSDGGIMLKIKRKEKRKNSAQISEHNMLLVKTKYPLVRLPFYKSYHILDYNLFWFDIRKNAAARVKHYLEEVEKW